VLPRDHNSIFGADPIPAPFPPLSKKDAAAAARVLAHKEIFRYLVRPILLRKKNSKVDGNIFCSDLGSGLLPYYKG